jgi:DNA polymerase-4
MRTILHLDLDAFFCAVEELRDPALRGKPFAVGGRPEGRGVVASCSYPARQFGVRSAMPMGQAVRRCPPLLIVPPDFRAYRAASQDVMARLGEVTPLVEQISIDEAFLDVTGLPDAGEPLARALQAGIRHDLKLPCSFGVASNKLVAKIANNIGKDSQPKDRPPNAITVVPPGGEAEFLAPLPIRELWGVGPKTAERLQQMRILTIGDLARHAEADLVRWFGKHGADLWRHARGIDDRPVETEHEAKSVSKETTFAHDVRDGAVLRQTLRDLSDGVGWRLRKAGLRGATVKLKLRWSDFTTLTRQVTLTPPIDSDDAIYSAALGIFEATWSEGRAVRLIGVGVSGFGDEDGGHQLGLWDAPSPPADANSQKLQTALDQLKGKFGEGVIKRGRSLKRDDDA